MLRDLAEEEPADENSLAASQDHMNGPRRRDLAGPAAPSDAAIIERSVAVPECFAEIFDRHAAGIYRYAARRLGRQAAADVMCHQRSQCFSYSATDRDRDTGSMNRVMVDATHNGPPSALSTINQLITGDLVALYDTGTAGVAATVSDLDEIPKKLGIVLIDQGFTGSPNMKANVRDCENGAWLLQKAVNKTGMMIAAYSIYPPMRHPSTGIPESHFVT